MRLITPSTRTDIRTGERGQAIVLVAMMLVVLMGFVGLAIDGGRLYWERRILQNAVDAAALGASDNYQGSASISSSIQAAAREYAANERIYGTASANPSWAASTADVRWTGSTDVMHVVYTAAGSVSAFDVSSQHTIPLAFMMVLGAGNTATVSATAQGHAKTGGVNGSALTTLSQGNCNGTATSLSVQGASTKIVVNGGNVQSNGSVNAGGAGIQVSGTFSDNCTNPVPAGVTATTKIAGVAPVADPAFSPGPLANYPTAQAAGNSVVLQPGIYAADPMLSGTCQFMAPGIFQFNGGTGGGTGVLSNELRPPDEAAWNAVATPPAPNYNSAVASPQYWAAGGAGCAGSFSVATVPTLLDFAVGSWGVVVTSTRTETYPPGGTTYYRESFPSTCHAAAVPGAGAGIQVTINNVPGAQGYNVYIAFVAGAGQNACLTGPWGYVGHLTNIATEVQGALGTTLSPIYDRAAIPVAPIPAAIGQACQLGTTYTANCAAATGSFGAANPPGDGAETAPQASGLAPFTAARDIVTAGGGDRANEHECLPSSTNSAAPCAIATVTPGAVQAYFPAGACIVQTQGYLGWFSGYQFNYIAVYAPPANTCSNTFSGRSRFGTGAVYWPSGNFLVTGNGGAPFASQIICNTFTAQGNGTLTISYDIGASPSQGFSQISN